MAVAAVQTEMTSAPFLSMTRCATVTSSAISTAWRTAVPITLLSAGLKMSPQVSSPHIHTDKTTCNNTLYALLFLMQEVTYAIVVAGSTFHAAVDSYSSACPVNTFGHMLGEYVLEA